VRIALGTSYVLTEGFCGFPQSLQESLEIVKTLFGHYCFRLSPLLFIILESSHNLGLHIADTGSVDN
jgi:hypothetical protein